MAKAIYKAKTRVATFYEWKKERAKQILFFQREIFDYDDDKGQEAYLKSIPSICKKEFKEVDKLEFLEIDSFKKSSKSIKRSVINCGFPVHVQTRYFEDEYKVLIELGVFYNYMKDGN